MTTHLFVYGTLQPGGPNEHELSTLQGQWRPATIKGYLRRSGWGASLGYPGLVIDEVGDVIHGQVLTSVALPDHWERLDCFEGKEYKRVIATVVLEDGDTIDAHTYILSDALNAL